MPAFNLSRRQWLGGATALWLCARSDHAAAAERVPVATPAGRIDGRVEGGLHVFRGIPFADPPVGPRRFRPASALAPWPGVLDATRPPPTAMQSSDASVRQSEDCLRLNVWAPPGGRDLPVFVWFHGGGYIAGDPSAPLTDGTAFAPDGVVHVTVGYRLGALGFLDVAPLLGETYRGSANNGLSDAVCALRWVRTNIEAFGGSPDRVTIGGESAGGKLVGTLMGTPAAQPLFARAIAESGGGERVADRAEADDLARRFGAVWRTHGWSDAALATAPPGAIMAAQHELLLDPPREFPFRPEIGTALLPRSPLDALRRGSMRGKRLLAGSNRDEAALFLGPAPQADPTQAQISNKTRDEFERGLARYGALYPAASPALRRIRALTASEYWLPTNALAEAAAAGGADAWLYLLRFPAPSGDLAGFAYHSYDLHLAFARGGGRTPEAMLARDMHRAWLAFLRGGDPQGRGLPRWPAWNSRRRTTMMFDARSGAVDDPYRAERLAWNRG